MLAKLKRSLSLLPGWKTSRKLLVIQSDDWFSIRTSSAAALAHLKSLGADVDRCHYMRCDHFEREEDLSGVFDTLSSVLDSRGRPACLTANCLSANPHFRKIAESGFAEYHYEPAPQTASRVGGAANSLKLWQEAISSGVCEPQSHGREHLNVGRWLSALQSGTDEITRAAFDHEMFGVSAHVVPTPRGSFMAAFDTPLESEQASPELVVSEALRGFQSMFGFPSRSFIAPNYVWSDDVEKALADNGVRYLQSGRAQWFPKPGENGRGVRRRFLGHVNALGQTYLVRNVELEPSSNPSMDWQASALSQIALAFRMRKPAVISTHRVNFMGGLDPSNRDRGLKDLSGLLASAVKRWPGIEFVSTTELGEIVSGKAK